MGLNARENINGNTPQDLNKLNNNFMTIWKTLFGGLDFSDTNSALKKKIQTQQIPVQGEGNFDSNFPLYIRFFVPSNTKSITSTSFNLICERYRMDSGVANGGGGVVDADINMSLASANTGVASVSSPTVGVSSVGGGGTTSATNSETSSYVNMWGNWNADDPSNTATELRTMPPTFELFGNYMSDKQASYQIRDLAPYGGIYSSVAGRYQFSFAPVYKGFYEDSDKTEYWLDLATVQHKHTIKPHTHSLPDHSHSISLQPHSHTITLQPHTHDATAKLNLPDHIHELNEGIKISSKSADNVTVKLNGNVIANMDSNANATKNNINSKDFIKIGEWNVIECTTTSLARITMYGIIELVMNY